MTNISKILLYGMNYSPELTGVGKYTAEMASWLRRMKLAKVDVVTAVPHYPEWRVPEGYDNYYSTEAEGSSIIVRCPLFIPNRSSFFLRLVHLISFAFSSNPVIFFKLFKNKPDVLMIIVPTLFIAPLPLLLAKIIGIPTVIHIQDYEVDAMFGLAKSRLKFLSAIAKGFERHVLRSADFVSTISNGMRELAIRKGVETDRLLMLPNWADAPSFGQHATDFFEKKFGLPSNSKVVLYAGNVGEKQGLEALIDLAQSSLNLFDTYFVIVGAGRNRDALETDVSGRELSNVIFADLVPKKDLPYMLSSANCHLIIQKEGIADAVLPSKLTNILAVGGNAIIVVEPETTLFNLVRDNPDIAMWVPPSRIAALKEAVIATIQKPIKNDIAVRYAEQNLRCDAIIECFYSELNSKIESKALCGGSIRGKK